MVNLETLKKDVYRREKRKLLHKFIFGNLLLVLLLSITLSGTRVTEREKELLNLYRIEHAQNESLRAIKQVEDKLLGKSLSISMDTNYIDKNLTINDINQYTKKQMDVLTNIEKTVDNKWNSINSMPVGLPMSLADCDGFSDGFGYRKHPITHQISFHEGQDIDAVIGSEVFTTGNGVVDKVIKNINGFGNMIIINHLNGYKTLYAHLSRFNVVIGQKVKKNDVIGYVGNTGLSTGPHLHYEILIKNRPINPIDFLHLGDENVLVSK